jgi:hypothetical protein
MASRTAQAGLQSTGGVGTSTYANSVAGGCIGYITRTTNAGPVSGAAADIGGLAVTFTVNASRLILLEFWCSAVSATDTTTWGQVNVVEGSNIFAYSPTGTVGSAGLGTGPAVVVRYLWVAPSAGSHTIKGQLARVSGAGSVTIAAGTDRPMYIAAYDVGPAF